MKNTSTLAGIGVLDVQQNPITLGSLWADGAVVLVFIRHFG